MYFNYTRLSKTSLSIALAIICFIVAIVFLIIGVNYDGNVLVGFIFIVISFLVGGADSIVTFVKCRKFGDENANKTEPPKNIKNQNLYKKLVLVNSILTIVCFALFIVGIIIMLA